jgi:hypothetical protein
VVVGYLDDGQVARAVAVGQGTGVVGALNERHAL